MKGNRMNRQATRRISIPVAVCLTLMASCVSKPIEQDLASGDATVEIKYLDSMTVDIIDDIRMKRREFYKDVLTNKNWKKEYPQGTQGAIDRQATIAAAINANAQRDQSVLERYSAEGSRQLSALENSEELGNEVLEHNKKIISQTNQLNDAKVQAVESQAETLAELNKAKVKAVETLVEDYNKRVEIIDRDIKSSQEELAGQNAEKKKWLEEVDKLDKKMTNRASETANMAIWKKEWTAADEKQKAAEKEIEKIESKITALHGERKEAYQFLAEIFKTEKESIAKVDTTLIRPASDNHGMDLSQFNRTDKEFANAGIKYTWKTDTSQPNGGYWEPESKEEINITQHPQAPAPDVPEYMKSAALQLQSINAAITKIANANTDEAMRKADKVLAPPIERVRNDEAVLDYLLDGYRDTQIYSGAEYGGMVRRVLPFSFVFTPGSGTQSGFGARVVLKPDQKQIDEAIKMIQENIEHINQSRTAGYMQLYAQAEKESGQLTRNLLQEEYDSKCRDVTSAFQHQANFHQKFKEVFDSQANKPSFASSQQFWMAYSASIEAITLGLKNHPEEVQRISNASYTYDLGKAMSGIKSSIANVKKFQDIPQSTDLTLERPVLHDSSLAAAYASCVVSKQLEKEISLQKNSNSEHDAALDKLLEEINQLVMAMTSAGLVHEVYLQNNPKYHTTGTQGKTIEVVESALCSNPNADRCYQAVSKEFPYGDLKQEVENNAQVRLVQNTSREHVVEIADTAKMNTLLAAAVTANEVTDKLGLNIGGEIAAALSSASAFIKRIPYAVPFTGQSFSIEKKNQGDKNQNEHQIFGWKYYKTPSGATQMGRVTHSFKTTPLNSAVVVSMPEWMSNLTAEYEISPDGKNWVPVGKEKIILSGASVRSRLMTDDVKAKPFNTWVKYNIYQDGDASLGLPKLTSCYNKEDKIIFGSSTGETAICGENLYGVKGVLIGGKFIDEGIEKISNNLIKVKKIGLGPDDCPSGSASTCTSNSKCRVVLLSDFGASPSEDYCLEFSYSEKETGGVDLSKMVNLTFGTESKFKFENHATNSLEVLSYRIGAGGKNRSYNHVGGFTKNDDELIHEFCMKNKESSCKIPVYGSVKIGTNVLSGLLGEIDMDSIGNWEPYPGNPDIYEGAVCETGPITNTCSFQIRNISWETGKPYSLKIGNKEISSDTSIDGLTYTNSYTDANEEITNCSATRAKFKEWCTGIHTKDCRIEFNYKYHDVGYIGKIEIEPDTER